MFRALRLRYKELEEDNKVRGVVLTAKPGVFSAGLDLPFLSSLPRNQFQDWFRDFTDCLSEMSNTRLTTVAAISGHAPAGGAVLALTTDYRIMAQGNFGIGLNEVNVAVEVPVGVIALARNALGLRNAEKVILSGRLWPVDEALKMGLVDEVVAPDQLMARSEKFLQERLDHTKPRAVAYTKKALRTNLVKAFEEQKALAKPWIDAFYAEETQKFIAEFKANLAKKKS
jgi:enoyl-CoA hydratase/carnithine racemase